MNKWVGLLLAAGTISCLAACDGSHKEKPVAEGHVWQDQVESLEKAKAVEAQMLESTARQNQAIDEAVKGGQ